MMSSAKSAMINQHKRFVFRTVEESCDSCPAKNERAHIYTSSLNIYRKVRTLSRRGECRCNSVLLEVHVAERASQRFCSELSLLLLPPLLLFFLSHDVNDAIDFCQKTLSKVVKFAVTHAGESKLGILRSTAVYTESDESRNQL